MRFPHLDGRAGKLADALDLPAELAEWIAPTALHSGCFLRSQLQFYGGYYEEHRVSLTRVVRKLLNKQLITETSYESLGLLARVTNKAIYRLIGADNIRHRRETSWPLTFRRLLSLDYVLDHPQLPWLPVEEEKVACFDQLGIDRAHLPHRVWHGAVGHTVRLFANMVAGHLMLTLLLVSGVIFVAAVGDIGLKAGIGIVWFAFGLAIFVFEVVVAVLQAYIFTLLTAVYIQTSLEPAH